jgi:signal transduction histidine kinase
MINIVVFRSAQIAELSGFFLRLSFVIGMSASFAFLRFALSFPENKKPSRTLTLWLLAAFILIAYLILRTDIITTGTFPVEGITRWGIGYGPLWFLFDIFFDATFVGGLVIMYRKYKRTKNQEEKRSLNFMFWSMTIAVIPISLTNIILPRLGIFDFIWFGPFTFIGWVSLVSYSIARFRQMNVRAMFAEVLLLVMGAVLFINIFVAETLGFVARTVIFVVFLLISYFFIKSVLREREQKEQLGALSAELKDLNEHLEEKVKEQTIEIRQAYEIEKKARVDLQKLNEEKDRFLLATQHNLRTPLTVVKGYIDAALQEEKDAGPRDYLEKASKASTEMVGLLNNVLEVAESRVKQK